MKYKKQNQFHAYRGTSEDWGEKWEENRDLKWSDRNDEYFGHGHYFFENDLDEALSWAYYNPNIKKENIAVIYGYIETEKVLDLTLKNTYEEYKKFLKESIELFKKDDNKPELDGEDYDCKLINYLIDEEGYEMVKSIHSPNDKKWKKLIKKGYTKVAKHHIQLCVVNKDIIKESCVYYYDRKECYKKFTKKEEISCLRMRENF